MPPPVESGGQRFLSTGLISWGPDSCGGAMGTETDIRIHCGTRQRPMGREEQPDPRKA